MRKFLFILISFFAVVSGLMTSCIEDDSNSILEDFENEFGKNTAIEIEFDSIRAGRPNNQIWYATSAGIPNGTELFIPMQVKYAYPERLRYFWILLPYKNGGPQVIQQGNSFEYVQGDTVCREKDLHYVVDCKPNDYQMFFIAEDSVNGMFAYYSCSPGYQGFEVPRAGIKNGLYLLCETEDGNTDIEIYTSRLMLIYGAESQTMRYYNSLFGHPIPGKPRFIRGGADGMNTSKNTYVIATDENMYRFDKAGLVTMSEWDEMFYKTPEVYNPQNLFFTNLCEYLINDGKLYTMYVSRPGSRKFSAPVTGDSRGYELSSYLMFNSKQTWGGVTPGAINVDQVLYDRKNHRFIPYYTMRTNMSVFSTTNADAVLDANKLDVDPKYIFNGVNNSTYCIMDINGETWLYRYNFFNVADKGDFSADGARSKLNISNCTDIANAKYFTNNKSGAAFYYSSGKNVYSFSPQTGQTDAKLLYECEGDEEITCLYAWGNTEAGFPTYNVVLYIAVWSESKKEGKLIEYEMNHQT